jgi:predicted nucleic acid-binding protein
MAKERALQFLQSAKAKENVVSRIYWDSMLFIYWIESHPVYAARINEIFKKSLARGDQICTSIFTIGEVLVLPVREQNLPLKEKAEAFFDSGLLDLLPINRDVAERFASVRAGTGIAPADALHLACAGAHGTDLFLTNDKSLHRHQIPGIHFIGGLDVNLF